MSYIGQTLPPAVAPAASAATQGSGTASRAGDGGSALNARAQVSASSSPAALVTISGNGSKTARSATKGPNRQTDAAFEKQETKGKPTEKREEEGKKSLNVSA